MKKISVVIPKGSIYTSIIQLFLDAGIDLQTRDRAYRPRVSDEELEIKIMRPQNIPKLIELGSHDIGFTGHDWVVETQADVVEVMDLGLDPVEIVAAIPNQLKDVDLHKRKIVVASEYEYIAKQFLAKEKYQYVFLRTFGATEVFPPDDADMIIDNTSTGQTLKEHDLDIVTTILESSTRFIAKRKSFEQVEKKEKINELKMLFQSVLDARDRVMLEMNIAKDKFEQIIQILPCMRSPTVSPLYGDQGYAVKIAVERNQTVKLIPKLKRMGATDILEYEFRKVVA